MFTTVHRSRRLLRTFALAAGVFSMAVQSHAQSAQNLPTLRLNAGIHNIDAMVATTPDERSTGLMHRREMPPHAGMLFVFEQPATQCFWMKNTLLPLSAAFVSDDGTVVNVVDMQPQTLDSHCSTQPVRYVLEMNQGWFARRGIRAGSRLAGGPFNR